MPTSHDALFRQVCADVAPAGPPLASAQPHELAGAIDWSTVAPAAGGLSVATTTALRVVSLESYARSVRLVR